MHPYLDARQLRSHKRRNVLHSLALVGGMAALLFATAWLIWGFDMAVGILVGLAVAVIFRPAIPPKFVMSLYGARPIDPRALPELSRVVAVLAERAELPTVPRLYYLPSETMNAFAVGGRKDAVVGLTDGMLRRLELRELAGVLAHEISHVRNNDLRIMGLADLLTRFTSIMSYAGMFLVLLNLPLVATGAAHVPWLAVLLLIFAPTLGSLLQMGLSRAREYEADLDAAGLTGDPAGLARALEKLERYQGRFWEELVMPGRRIPEPSLLRTHPPAEERIRRLLELTPSDQLPDLSGAWEQPPRLGRTLRPPRYHWSGLWY